jgi:UDP:flavonoid glycosyltransferase YjiC (YdhE family)
MYTEADYVLYPDVPEFTPTANLPGHHWYVGTCDWTPPVSKPEWWEKMRAEPNPKVLIALGSSGPWHVMPGLLSALMKLGATVLLATSGWEIPPGSRGVFAATILPLAAAARESAVVVSHGGSSGVYPALAAGTPVLGIPANADQHLSAAVLEESGAGLSVRSEEATEKLLRKSLEALLLEARFREKAREWAGIFAKYDTGDMFRTFLRSVFTPDETGIITN